MTLLHDNDTICAIATAQGGAIAIVRVSGSQALSIVSQIFRPVGAPLSARPSHSIAFGRIVTPVGDVLDEALASIFRAPHSYTGEESVELSCHASPYILQQTLQLLTANGCRSAQPGEFTQRAFLNGKMDLSQAEAVADLIASTSASAHRLAMDQMRGGFSRELHVLREKLLYFNALLELELDFSDHEELEFADRTALAALAAELERLIARLVNTFQVGNAIKRGIPVAIIGATNAGKSTLLNALLHEERAIVSDIHGTTRDVIEDTINLQGITFRFIDTAGIRPTDDTIEQMGIARTYEKIAQASIVLWIADVAAPADALRTMAHELLPRCKGKRLFLLLNKVDLLSALPEPPLAGVSTLFISARQGDLSTLEADLVAAAALPEVGSDDVIVTNARHHEALLRAHAAILRLQEGMAAGLSGDLLSEDLRLCSDHLGEILAEGAVTTDETLRLVFSQFCIGK